MIRAYAQAIRDHEALGDISLVLVISPDRFFAESRRLIRTLGIGEHVQIHRNISEDEKKAFYHCSRALYLVTKFEGVGLPLLEAQACSVPVTVAAHTPRTAPWLARVGRPPPAAMPAAMPCIAAG